MNNSEKTSPRRRARRVKCETRGRNPLPSTLCQRRCNVFTEDKPALGAESQAAGISEPTFIAYAVRFFLTTPRNERIRIIIGGPKMEEA